MGLIRGGEILKTVAAVVDALGGNKAVYDLADMTPQEVTNARAAGRFPSKFYVLFTDALAAKGASADPALWGMKAPRRRRSRVSAVASRVSTKSQPEKRP